MDFDGRAGRDGASEAQARRAGCSAGGVALEGADGRVLLHPEANKKTARARLNRRMMQLSVRFPTLVDLGQLYIHRASFPEPDFRHRFVVSCARCFGIEHNKRLDLPKIDHTVPSSG